MTSLIPFSNGRFVSRLRSLLFAAAYLSLACLGATAQWQTQTLSAHVPNAVSSSRLVRSLAPESQLHLAIGLPLRNQAELDALLAQIADPSSPNFRHFLTPGEFAARFGPTEQDYQSIIAFAQQNGLTITGTHSNRGVLAVSGDTAAIERAFHVKMKVYSHPQRGEFYAPDREPTVAAGAAILDVSGLDNFAPPQPMSLNTRALTATSPYVTGSGPYGYFIGKDFRAAYAPGVTLTGAGQTVGLLEFDGFFPGDVTKNFAQAGLPVVPTQTVLLDGFNGSAGGANVEVILDIMMASYMAPGLSKVIVYEGYNPNDVLNRMATDNLAPQLSSSWGFGSQNATTEQIFKQFIAQGQSLLQASGDSGAYKGTIMAPSDSPSLTVVGGTSLSTSGSGGPWAAESAWSGSGGGISTVYPIPTYQVGTTMPSGGGSKTMRNIPDVALTADIQMYLICNNGQAISVGGTSAAAPLWAGFIALANQQAAANAKPRVGFLNPLVYAIGNSSKFASDFNDIRSGSNGFAAVTGYDLATGWGSPAGQHLIYDLTGTSGAPSFTLSSSVPALSIAQATSGSATVTVAKQNGFNSSVTLAVTGLPTGVTAAFSPSTTGTGTTSVLTLAVGASAVRGTYPLTITGTYGSLSSATPLSLTVLSPGFTLSASASAVSVLENGTASAATTITVAGIDGFSSAVTLSTSALPLGVSAVFTPATTTSTSSVSFKASTTTPPGIYTLSVKGVSGTLSGTVPLAITVPAPAFNLTNSVAAPTVTRSASVTTVVGVASLNGFNGLVTLSATGLPNGVTASFSPTATSTSSTLTLAASAGALAGVYPITVNGVSGTLKATETFNLTVTVPSFTVSFLPKSIGLPRGLTASGTATIVGLGGFTGTVAFSTTGLPAGVTATATPVSSSGTSQVTFTASATATAGTFPLTLSGVSGSLTSSTPFTLTVIVPATSNVLANLAPAYNVNALATDGTTFGGGGFDGGLNGSATAYSANLIGLQQTIAGTQFFFGPADTLDAVSGKTIALPAGQFASIKLLGAGVNGSQLNQVFKVTYTDGSTVSIAQNVSDWFSPQNFAGETKAMTMPYRNNSQAQRDNRTFYLYEYSLPVIAGKTVASITLPNNRNVIVLAVSLPTVVASQR